VRERKNRVGRKSTRDKEKGKGGKEREWEREKRVGRKSALEKKGGKEAEWEREKEKKRERGRELERVGKKERKIISNQWNI
jgi:hypothetical protein